MRTTKVAMFDELSVRSGLFMVLGLICVFAPVCLSGEPETTGAFSKPATTIDSSHLSEEQVKKVRQSLERVDSYLAAANIADNYRDLPVTDYLIGVINDPQESVSIRNSALFWLGMTRDIRALPTFLKIINTPLPDPVSGEELEALRCAILALGFNGSEEALDLVFKMMTVDYWKARGGAPACPDRNYSRERTEIFLRQQAAGGLGSSGTDRAIHAFATGENVPPDLLEMANICLLESMYRQCGVYSMPDSLDALEPEKRARFEIVKKRVFAKYGNWKKIDKRIKALAKKAEKTN